MVIIPSPVAVSVEVPRGDAFWAVSDNGDYATGMNSHGGITITQSPTSAGVIDANPERIQVGRMLDKSKSTVKPLTVGSKLRDIIGLVNFSFGNWKVYPIEPVSIISVNQANNVTTRYPQSVRVTACDLVIANYNVENLHVSNPEKKFLRLADQFVKNLKSPDIVGLQEIQGDKVDSADGLLVSSSDTMKKLIRYIKSAGKNKSRVNKSDG